MKNLQTHKRYDSLNYRRMIWDEENRLALLSDNGNGNNYIYDHSGERVIKCQTGLQNVYIDGLPAGMLQNTRNYTVYVSPNMVVKNDGYTKHYYAGAERVLSKLGAGEFNNRFTPTNKVITAGNMNYLQRQQQLQHGIEEHYRELQIPPGNPTQKPYWGQPEQTGEPIPTVAGNYEIPRGWPREPVFNPPGGPPGPPIQFGEPTTNDNVTAGYGYVPNALEERDLYFYHPDHLGSTSIITDKVGVATQFVCYMPFGEPLVDEHVSRKEMPYKFNGKEIDEETGLYYYGARYYDAGIGVWYGVDVLGEKHPNIGGYAYCNNNPILYCDPTGMSGKISIYCAGVNSARTSKDETQFRSEANREITWGTATNAYSGRTTTSFLQTLRDVTAAEGDIEYLSIYSHSGSMYLFLDNGQYGKEAITNKSLNSTWNKLGLTDLINDADIKFSSNALVVFAGCYAGKTENSEGQSIYSIAKDFTEQSGVAAIGATNSTYPSSKDKVRTVDRGQYMLFYKDANGNVQQMPLGNKLNSETIQKAKDFVDSLNN
jgi:RHS repeat-associated protein